MSKPDHGSKQLGFLAIATAALVFMAFIYESDRGHWFLYLAGWVVAGGAVFAFLRPDLVDLDIN